MTSMGSAPDHHGVAFSLAMLAVGAVLVFGLGAVVFGASLPWAVAIAFGGPTVLVIAIVLLVVVYDCCAPVGRP